ncbi:MAG: MFS transporter [Alphaproteobacteria bacterium]|nr:MFS transporter [Alphaproteobacteria bacterium]
MGGVVGLILLDETVVGVALPTIRHDLGLSLVASHWVVNAYLLVFAGFAAAGGKLGDIVGHRVLFTVSVIIFGLASLACGFAQDGVWLIAARAVQGIGAAVIFPASMAMITIVFPPEGRGVALGIYGAIGTVFLALGPLVGGFFTEVISWRWIFWINPVIVVAIAVIVLIVWRDPAREGSEPKLDVTGLSTLVGGLTMLVFAIMQGPDWGWSSPAILIPLVGGITVLGYFVLLERRLEAPLVEVALFASASFTACNLVVFAAQFSKIAIIIFGALYLQHSIGMSPLVAGLALVVAVVGSPMTAAASGKFADRYGSRRPALGGLACAVASVLWIGMASPWDDYLVLVPALVIWGAAMPFCFMPPQRAIMNAVTLDEQGQAGGIVMTAQLLGGTIGMAVCSTIYLITQDYQAVFLATGGFLTVVLVIGYVAIERDTGSAR